ncbi:PEX11-domain-containing protein [Schizophyllum commune H4-8]|nr:PEX11-domain-containing protein [Schizophyllum commune H4-8]KAI5897621.1 PEX11-domain-containing protein [Schizophyllum commune H4-8]
MASVASQVVFHPLVSQSLKVGNTTLGRDKAYRAVQYLARFIAWYLLSKGNKLDAARWSALKSHLALARKLLRLGKPVEHLQAALKAAFANAPPAEQLTTIARQLAYFGYLSFDALVWANSIKFLNLQPATAQRVSRISNRFWLAGILVSLAHGAVKVGVRLTDDVQITRLTKETKALKSRHMSEKDVACSHSLCSARAATREQIYIDALDAWIPAAALGLTTVNDGFLGLAGYVSYMRLHCGILMLLADSPPPSSLFARHGPPRVLRLSKPLHDLLGRNVQYQSPSLCPLLLMRCYVYPAVTQSDKSHITMDGDDELRSCDPLYSTSTACLRYAGW